MVKKKNKREKKSDSLAVPRQRGCLDCHRWNAFASKIWDNAKELCPEATCCKLASKL